MSSDGAMSPDAAMGRDAAMGFDAVMGPDAAMSPGGPGSGVTAADAVALADLVARYALYADERDFTRLTGLFTEDAELLLPDPPRALDPVLVRTGHRIAEAMTALEGLTATFHHAVAGRASARLENPEVAGRHRHGEDAGGQQPALGRALPAVFVLAEALVEAALVRPGALAAIASQSRRLSAAASPARRSRICGRSSSSVMPGPRWRRRSLPSGCRSLPWGCRSPAGRGTRGGRRAPGRCGRRSASPRLPGAAATGWPSPAAA